MFFTSERISIVEYIASPTPTRSKFVFQQPKLSYENNLFLLSFRWTVWYSTVGLVFLMFLALLVVALWEWKKTAKERSLVRIQYTNIINYKPVLLSNREHTAFKFRKNPYNPLELLKMPKNYTFPKNPYEP